MRLLIQRSLFICLLLLFSAPAFDGQTKSSSGYHLIKQVKLGGEGGWDALAFDAKAHRLYISKSFS